MCSSLVRTRNQSVSLLQLKTEKVILALHLNTSAAAVNDCSKKHKIKYKSILQGQYQFLYDALEVVYPVQNGDVKAAQNSVQIVNETAERPASTTSTDQQGAEEGADGGVSRATGEESSNGPTVTVEV